MSLHLTNIPNPRGSVASLTPQIGTGLLPSTSAASHLFSFLCSKIPLTPAPRHSGLRPCVASAESEFQLLCPSDLFRSSSVGPTPAILVSPSEATVAPQCKLRALILVNSVTASTVHLMSLDLSHSYITSMKYFYVTNSYTS